MGKGRRKQEREERRKGKGSPADRERLRRERGEREEIGRSAVENAKTARRRAQAAPDLDELPEHKAHIEAWREAGSPPAP